MHVSIYVLQFTPVGALINVTLTAVDPDFGDNARIQFRIIPGAGYPVSSPALLKIYNLPSKIKHF